MDADRYKISPVEQQEEKDGHHRQQECTPAEQQMERDECRRLQVLAGGATDGSFTRLPEVYPSARDYSSVWLVAFGYIQMPSDGLILVQRQWAPARGSPINRSCSHARPTRMLGGWPVCHSASVAWSVGCACVAHGTSIGPRSVWPWRGGGDTRHPAPACLLLYRLGALLTRALFSSEK